MTFLDYTFTVVGDSDIIFDKELTLEKLGLKEGDTFELVTVCDTVVLKKLNNATEEHINNKV